MLSILAIFISSVACAIHLIECKASLISDILGLDIRRHADSNCRAWKRVPGCAACNLLRRTIRPGVEREEV